MSQATIASGAVLNLQPRCYLEPIRHRKNLHIETSALTEAVVLDGKARCVGVRYSVRGTSEEAAASRKS